MNSKKLVSVLQKLGLTEKESVTYLTLLQQGESTALIISNKSGIKRSTVYTIFESLIERGLVSKIYNGSKKRFVAETPHKLEDLLQKQTTILQEHLPDFLELHSLPNSEQSVQVYEGIEGLKNGLNTALKDLKNGDDYFVIANIEELLNIMPEFFKEFAMKRSKYKINLKTILQDGPKTRRYIEWAEQKTNEQIKIIPAESTLTANIVVTPYRVIMPHLKPFVGAVIIENQQAVSTHKKIFEMLWEAK